MTPAETFAMLVDRHGIPLRAMLSDKGRKASDVRAEWFALMADGGATQTAIAKASGRHPSTISRALARHRAGAQDHRKFNGGRK